MAIKQSKKLEVMDKFNVEYKQNYAVRMRRFVKYNTEVDIKFTQVQNYDASSGSANKYVKTYAEKVNRFVMCYSKVHLDKESWFVEKRDAIDHIGHVCCHIGHMAIWP